MMYICLIFHAYLWIIIPYVYILLKGNMQFLSHFDSNICGSLIHSCIFYGYSEVDVVYSDMEPLILFSNLLLSYADLGTNLENAILTPLALFFHDIDAATAELDEIQLEIALHGDSDVRFQEEIARMCCVEKNRLTSM